MEVVKNIYKRGFQWDMANKDKNVKKKKNTVVTSPEQINLEGKSLNDIIEELKKHPQIKRIVKYSKIFLKLLYIL